MDTPEKDIKFMQDPQLIRSRQIFDGAILRLYVNDLKLKENGQIVERELIHHQAAVAILANPSPDEVILVKQFRPAIVQEVYEIPAGLIDRQAEDPLKTAQRELEEETAYQADTWKELESFFVSPGFLDEEIFLFHAQDLKEVAQPLEQDDDEFVTAHIFSRQEIKDMLKNKEIIDLKTLYALRYWLSLGGN